MLYLYIVILLLAVCLLILTYKFKVQRMAFTSRLSELESELLKSQSLEQQKSDFLAVMSHEIRTPLNGILVAAKLLSENEYDPLTNDCVDIINNSGGLLLGVVNDILDFSKLEAGKLELDYRNFSLQKTVDNIYFTFKKQFEDKGIELVIDLDESVPDIIFSDENRIKQVLFNLIGNAFKFTHKGSVRLSIDAKNDRLHMEVKDSGIGMSEDALQRIFEKYSQADLTTQTSYGGTGLGLTITRQLVHLLGGEIHVDSKLGVGSRFLFDINLEKVDQQLVAEEKESSSYKSFKDLNVLLADDNPINRKVGSMLFKKFDVDVDLAVDGLDALEKVKQKKYDIVFLDVLMPGLEGPDVSEKMLEMIPYTELPLIYALSANAFKECKDRCFNSGMNGFVEKPINIDKIRQALESVAST